MTATGDVQCPSCGQAIPSESGWHAGSMVSATVECPHCGESVALRQEEAGSQATGDVERAEAAPPGRTEGTEAFSGNESVADLAEELRSKPN